MKKIDKIHKINDGYIKTEITVFKPNLEKDVITYKDSNVRLVDNAIIITKVYDTLVIQVRIYNCNKKGYFNNEFPGNIDNEFLNNVYSEIEKLLK